MPKTSNIYFIAKAIYVIVPTNSISQQYLAYDFVDSFT